MQPIESPFEKSVWNFLNKINIDTEWVFICNGNRSLHHPVTRINVLKDGINAWYYAVGQYVKDEFYGIDDFEIVNVWISEDHTKIFIEIETKYREPHHGATNKEGLILSWVSDPVKCIMIDREREHEIANMKGIDGVKLCRRLIKEFTEESDKKIDLMELNYWMDLNNKK